VKIYRKIVIDIETLEILYEDSFEYEGPIAKCEEAVAAIIYFFAGEAGVGAAYGGGVEVAAAGVAGATAGTEAAAGIGDVAPVMEGVASGASVGGEAAAGGGAGGATDAFSSLKGAASLATLAASGASMASAFIAKPQMPSFSIAGDMNSAGSNASIAAQSQAEALLKRRGLASTIMTSPTGATGTPGTLKSTLGA